MKSATRLIVADSEKDANMLYAVGMFVPDPFIWFEHNGRSYAVFNDLEIDRARKQARVDRVLPYSRYQNTLKARGIAHPKLHEVLLCVLREHDISRVETPSNFPIGLARRLRGVNITVADDPFFPGRQIKTRREIEALADAQALAEKGMMAAIHTLQAARVGRDKVLYWGNQKLTSEHVQGVINATIAGLGGSASHTIVAGGNQACDPHEAGHGPLRAHQAIIIDIFPRDTHTGYFGDITRTVVRGKASDALRGVYAVVKQAQAAALSQLRPGVEASEIHAGIHSLFAQAGYKTGKRNGRMQGFFHGTGHGLGLEIHEAPRIAIVPQALAPGHVVTVEPGLYYPGIGGVRIEDVAAITSRGHRNLTTFPKQFEI
jgi:Xaa-Pro aminopeptidase